uniref:Uncharacterized protein n=1 Tax=Setaria viridis TaxID=4556 RepID=A0A4V6DBH6_SETVI|nr:hypothetical protein SEVIR_2G264400v2 [Setaria viridis]
MDISNVDLRPGLNFSSKVRSLLGARISTRPSSTSPSFWLLASFSRSKIKLSVTNVGFLLQSFCVSCKEVGLLIYQMGSSQCDIFKVDFNLFNDRGTHFPWISVSSKKTPSPLTGANSLPLGRSMFRQRSSSSQGFHGAHISASDLSGNRWNRINSLDLRTRAHEQRTPEIRNSNRSSLGINLDLNLGQAGQSFKSVLIGSPGPLATAPSPSQKAPPPPPPFANSASLTRPTLPHCPQNCTEENLSPSFGPSLVLADLQEAFMAYKFVNPAPFMPRGCQRQMVGFRKPMSRVVLGGARRNQSDVAIAKIEPLPQLQVSFQSIRELLDDFLRNHKAYVRFHFVHDKDFLIGGGQHQYGQYRISFSDHNRGWNNRLTTMNYEAWVMLLGLNIDYWTKSDIEKAVAVFGRLLVWEEDPNNLARVIVEVRVVDLTEIPWFLVCSEGEDFEGNSLLGVGHEDESQPPDEVDRHMFDFFGYGQPSNAVGHNAQGAGNGAVAEHGPAQQWGLWPEGPQGQNNAPFIGPQPPPEVPIVQALPANQEQNVPPQDANLDGLGQDANPNGLDFDLNMAVDDDLGGIDNLIQAADNQGAKYPMEDNMQIIDGTDSSGSDDIPPHNFNNEPVQVDVCIPQNDGQPLHMVQDDINENELLGENQAQEGHHGLQNNPMHLGFVQTFGPCQDPVFLQMERWAKHFSSGNPDSQVQVPLAWSHFFMAQLMNPMSFVWAKSFLSSPAMQFLQSEPALQLSLPNKCPNDRPLVCPSKDSSNQGKGLKAKDIMFEGESSWVDMGCTVNDEELRRSSRNLNYNQGFKSSRCKDKNCIGCSAAPPTLSKEVIRNLGESFCKVDASKLTSVTLVKKKPTAPVTRKLVKKKSAADADDAQEAPRSNKKKPKKQ